MAKQRVGEPGRPYLPWKQGIGGSNPPTLTSPHPYPLMGECKVNVKPWPKMTGKPAPLPRALIRPCDYLLLSAVMQCEVQLGSVEAYNRLVLQAERLLGRIEAGEGKAQNPLYAVDVRGAP